MLADELHNWLKREAITVSNLPCLMVLPFSGKSFQERLERIIKDAEYIIDRSPVG